VIELVGLTVRDPDAATVPRPSILIWSAFVVCHVSYVDCPCEMMSGLADKAAVGVAGGGGGEGGIALATFLLQPPNSNMPTTAMDKIEI